MKIFIIIMMMVITSYAYSDVTLIQSFEEANNIGLKTSFGYSICSAGDINGDNFDDIIVGAHSYDNYTGRVYIFWGGLVIDPFADIILTGENITDLFGHSVISAGDLNGDGFDDVVVGAYRHNYYTGRVYIYFGGSEVNDNANFILNGEQYYSNFGFSISGATDLNNDGFDDIIVGAYGYDSNRGRVYIYFGGALMDDIADVELTGIEEYIESDTQFYRFISLFGHTVSGIGDMNGDGYDDIAVGSKGYSGIENNLLFINKVEVYYGGSEVDTIPDLTILGEDNFGGAISNCGDINNDGYSDLIVGSDQYNSNIGCVYVYYGNTSADNIADLVFLGETGLESFGKVLSSGDINHDGFDDVVVGGAYDCENDIGKVYCYFGGYDTNNDADIIVGGDGKYNFFGRAISSSGDVNNDGFEDIIVGEYGYNNQSGKVHIFFGGENISTLLDIKLGGDGIDNQFGRSVSNAGDVNNDGYDDIIIGACYYDNKRGCAYLYYGGEKMDRIVDLSMFGEETDNLFGRTVASAGDVNGDGFDDLVIGAYKYENSLGRVYLYYGGDHMDNIADIVITGEEPGSFFGRSVSSAGDVNGDEFDDIIIGGYGINNYTGKAYLYFGGLAMDNISDLTFEGEEAAAYYGFSVSDAGDVNKDGYDDIVIGAFEYNNGTGRVYLYYGNDPMNNVPDAIFDGEDVNSGFGYTVSSAGDIDADNYDDIFIGASSYDNLTGRVYLYKGGPNVGNLPYFVITGEEANNYFGYSLSKAGDLNGDGFDDIVIGAFRYGSNTGRTYIYHGGLTMDSNPGVVIDGENIDDYFGRYVSGAGDVNGDGKDEIIVGASSYSMNGKAYLYTFDAFSTNIKELAQFPESYHLSQNYPNPFNAETTIQFKVRENSQVQLTIFDVNGRYVVDLIEAKYEPGEYKISFDASDLSSGIYFYKIKINQYVEMKKMLLVK